MSDIRKLREDIDNLKNVMQEPNTDPYLKWYEWFLQYTAIPNPHHVIRTAEGLIRDTYVIYDKTLPNGWYYRDQDEMHRREQETMYAYIASHPDLAAAAEEKWRQHLPDKPAPWNTQTQDQEIIDAVEYANIFHGLDSNESWNLTVKIMYHNEPLPIKEQLRRAKVAKHGGNTDDIHDTTVTPEMIQQRKNKPTTKDTDPSKNH